MLRQAESKMPLYPHTEWGKWTFDPFNFIWLRVGLRVDEWPNGNLTFHEVVGIVKHYDNIGDQMGRALRWGKHGN